MKTTRIVFDNSNALCKEVNKQARIDTKAMENFESRAMPLKLACEN